MVSSAIARLHEWGSQCNRLNLMFGWSAEKQSGDHTFELWYHLDSLSTSTIIPAKTRRPILGAKACHWNSGQTVADRAKSCPMSSKKQDTAGDRCLGKIGSGPECLAELRLWPMPHECDDGFDDDDDDDGTTCNETHLVTQSAGVLVCRGTLLVDDELGLLDPRRTKSIAESHRCSSKRWLSRSTAP